MSGDDRVPPTYRLFQVQRAFGDLSAPRAKTFLAAFARMTDALDHLASQSREFTYTVEKYIGDDRQLRRIRMPRAGVWDTNTAPGDITTTWDKWVWDNARAKWRSTRFRYPDEVVQRNPWPPRRRGRRGRAAARSFPNGPAGRHFSPPGAAGRSFPPIGAAGRVHFGSAARSTTAA